MPTIIRSTLSAAELDAAINAAMHYAQLKHARVDCARETRAMRKAAYSDLNYHRLPANLREVIRRSIRENHSERRGAWWPRLHPRNLRETADNLEAYSRRPIPHWLDCGRADAQAHAQYEAAESARAFRAIAALLERRKREARKGK